MPWTSPADQTGKSIPPVVNSDPWTRLEAMVRGQEGDRRGLDFSRCDPLGLSHHPALRSAAMATLGRYRPGGPDRGQALPRPVVALHDRLARFLAMAEARTFPSACEAARATLAGLLRPQDHALIDAGAAPELFEAARATGATLHRCPPGSVDAIERRLRRLSRLPVRGRLIVAVPALAAMSSVSAELRDLLPVCARHGALLVVDVSQDLGILAPEGRGQAELQGCLGQIDILLGALSPGLGVTGGFAAFRDPGLATCLRPAAALSAVPAAAALAAFDLIESPGFRRRRLRLHGISLRLRNHLMADGLCVLGQASFLVPVRLSPATAAICSSLMRKAGPIVPLLAAPQVARHVPRWLVRLSVDHGPADVDDLAELIRDVTRACAGLRLGRMQVVA